MYRMASEGSTQQTNTENGPEKNENLKSAKRHRKGLGLRWKTDANTPQLIPSGLTSVPCFGSCDKGTSVIDLSLESDNDEAINNEQDGDPQNDSLKKEKQMRFSAMNDQYRLALTYSLNIYHKLKICDDLERNLSDSILSLSCHAIAVLSRVLFLKGPWLRESKIKSYLTREGFTEKESAAVVGELCSANVLLVPTTEVECRSVLDSSTLRKSELISMLRCLEPKSKLDTIDEIRSRLLHIISNTRTIFGASTVKLTPLMAKALRDDRLFIVAKTVYRACSRAICVEHVYLDYLDGMEADFLNISEYTCYFHECKIRGGPRIPSSFSPGFAVACGELRDEQSDPTTHHGLYQHIYASRETFIRFEQCLHLCVAMLIAVSDQQSDKAEVLDKSVALQLGIEECCIFESVSSCKEKGTPQCLIDTAMACCMDLERGSNVINEPNCSHLRDSYDAGTLLGKSLALGITWLEEAKRYTSAIEVLQYLLMKSKLIGIIEHRDRATWWERLVIDLEHLSAKEIAREMCRLAMADKSLDVANDPHLFGIRSRLSHDGLDCSDHASIFLQAPVSVILAKPFGNAGKGSNAKGKQKFVNIVDSEDVTCSVEQLALSYYAEDEQGPWRGIHTENVAVHEIFRTFMEEVILGGPTLQEALKSKYLVLSNRALDMFTTSFYESRKILVDVRIAQIRGWTISDVLNELKAKYKSKRRGDRAISFSLMQLICICLKPEGLASLCELLMKHHRFLGRGGAPDLLLIRTDQTLMDLVFDNEITDVTQASRFHPGIQGEIRFVEVKSENDRLANKQIMWLNELHRFGLLCEVLKVSVSGSAKVCRTPSLQRSQRKPRAKSNMTLDEEEE